MCFSKRVKTITSVVLILAAFMLSACAQGTATDAPEASEPTWTPRPYVAGTPDATLPSFGWTGGAGGATLAAPDDCAGEATSSSEITLTWSIPSDLVDYLGFRIYQGVESLEEEIADPELVGFVVGNLDPLTQYHFDVRTFDGSAESEADACGVDVTTLQ